MDFFLYLVFKQIKTHSMKRISVFLSMGVMLVSSMTLAQTKLIEKVEQKGNEVVIPYQKYVLANGLTLVVHEDHRGHHIGQKLLQYVEDYCKSIDCHKIMLLSNSARQRAHQFFEREGYSGSVSKGFKKYL